MTSEAAVPSGWRLARIIAAGIFAPTFAFSIYLVASRLLGVPGATSDYIAFTISVLIGVLFIWRVPGSPRFRILWCVGVTASIALWLWFYGFEFLCAVFHDCL
jgi:hypothetical protein